MKRIKPLEILFLLTLDTYRKTISVVSTVFVFQLSNKMFLLLQPLHMVLKHDP